MAQAGMDGGVGAVAAAAACERSAEVSDTAANSCSIATIDLSCCTGWLLSKEPGAEGLAQWVIPHTRDGRTHLHVRRRVPSTEDLLCENAPDSIRFSFFAVAPASSFLSFAALLQVVDAASGVCTNLFVSRTGWSGESRTFEDSGWKLEICTSPEELRAATSDGARLLRIVVCIVESPAPLTSTATLAFRETAAAAAAATGGDSPYPSPPPRPQPPRPPPPASSRPRPLPALSFDAMLDGPFTDAVVRAPGGRGWRVHRVLLAAASPALAAMFGGDLREGRAAEVTLRTGGGASEEEEAAAVELLLRHIYGADGALSVPLCVAPALFALAQSYLERSDLATWLFAALLAVQPDAAAVCRLGPLAHALCPEAWQGSLRRQCGMALQELMQLPEFGSWPLECLLGALRYGQGTACIQAASSWVAAQVEQRMETDAASTGSSSSDGEAAATAAAAAGAPGASGLGETAAGATAAEAFETALWRRVLPALRLQHRSAAELSGIRAGAPAAARAAGVDAAVLDAALALALRLEVRERGMQRSLAAARDRMVELEALVVQWQEQAQWAQRL